MTTTMEKPRISAQEAIAKVLESAANTKARPEIDCSKIPVGVPVRQGDVYVTRLDDDVHVTAPSRPYNVAAVNLETWPGSRHIIRSERAIVTDAVANLVLSYYTKFRECHPDSNLPNNPTQWVRSETPWSLTHHEHADLINLPPGVFIVHRQRDLATRLFVHD